MATSRSCAPHRSVMRDSQDSLYSSARRGTSRRWLEGTFWCATWRRWRPSICGSLNEVGGDMTITRITLTAAALALTLLPPLHLQGQQPLPAVQMVGDQG